MYHGVCLDCMDTGYTMIDGKTYACDCINTPEKIVRPVQVDSVDPIPFAWESMGPTASRAKVFQGWIVRIYAADKAEGAHIFIADANHDWKIEEPPPKIVEGGPYR